MFSIIYVNFHPFFAKCYECWICFSWYSILSFLELFSPLYKDFVTIAHARPDCEAITIMLSMICIIFHPFFVECNEYCTFFSHVFCHPQNYSLHLMENFVTLERARPGCEAIFPVTITTYTPSRCFLFHCRCCIVILVMMPSL